MSRTFAGAVAFLQQAYIHFFAVVGALSMASLVASLDWLDWPQIVLQMIDWWKDNAYPIVDFFINPILVLFAQFLDVNLTLPDPFRDYLGVGIALSFSRFRGAFFGWKKVGSENSNKRSIPNRQKVIGSILRKPFKAISIFIRTLLVWPVEVFLMTRLAFFAQSILPSADEEYIRNVKSSHFIALLPIWYFIFLVLASWIYSSYRYLFASRP